MEEAWPGHQEPEEPEARIGGDMSGASTETDAAIPFLVDAWLNLTAVRDTMHGDDDAYGRLVEYRAVGNALGCRGAFECLVRAARRRPPGHPSGVGKGMGEGAAWALVIATGRRRTTCRHSQGRKMGKNAVLCVSA